MASKVIRILGYLKTADDHECIKCQAHLTTMIHIHTHLILLKNIPWKIKYAKANVKHKENSRYFGRNYPKGDTC